MEQVDEGQAVLPGDAFHGRGVERQVGVLLLARGEIAGGRKVFEGDGRDQHQARSGLAVVGFAEGVLDEGVELGGEVIGAVRSVEGLIVAEEGDDGVGLQVKEPLVGSGEEALAVMLRIFGVEFLGPGEGPLGGPGRMRAEAGRIAGTSHVAHDQAVRRET